MGWVNHGHPNSLAMHEVIQHHFHGWDTRCVRQQMGWRSSVQRKGCSHGPSYHPVEPCGYCRDVPSLRSRPPGLVAVCKDGQDARPYSLKQGVRWGALIFRRSFWATGGHDGLSAACWPLQLAHLMVLPLEWCSAVRWFGSPQSLHLGASLSYTPLSSVVPFYTDAALPLWRLGIQLSDAHEHDCPGGVLQSFCPEDAVVGTTGYPLRVGRCS